MWSQVEILEESLQRERETARTSVDQHLRALKNKELEIDALRREGLLSDEERDAMRKRVLDLVVHGTAEQADRASERLRTTVAMRSKAAQKAAAQGQSRGEKGQARLAGRLGLGR